MKYTQQQKFRQKHSPYYKQNKEDLKQKSIQSIIDDHFNDKNNFITLDSKINFIVIESKLNSPD